MGAPQIVQNLAAVLSGGAACPFVQCRSGWPVIGSPEVIEDLPGSHAAPSTWQPHLLPSTIPSHPLRHSQQKAPSIGNPPFGHTSKAYDAGHFAKAAVLCERAGAEREVEVGAACRPRSKARPGLYRLERFDQGQGVADRADRGRATGHLAAGSVAAGTPVAADRPAGDPDRRARAAARELTRRDLLLLRELGATDAAHLQRLRSSGGVSNFSCAGQGRCRERRPRRSRRVRRRGARCPRRRVARAGGPSCGADERARRGGVRGHESECELDHGQAGSVGDLGRPLDGIEPSRRSPQR